MVLGVIGFYYSGSGAVMDYLREIDSLRMSKPLELPFAHHADGLLDLEYALCKRLDGGEVAIDRFLEYMSRVASSIGDTAQRRKFEKLVRDYVDSLIQVRWSCYRQLRAGSQEISRMPLYVRALKGMSDRVYTPKLAPRRSALRYYCYRGRRKLAKQLKRPYMKRTYRKVERCAAIQPEDFLGKTREFVARTIDLLAPGEGGDFVIDHGFSAYAPQSTFHFFSDPRAIVVWRDPRDQFVANRHLLGERSVLPVESVADFVTLMTARLRCMAQTGAASDSRTLYLRFEDMIYEYDRTTRQIDDFIGVDRARHSRRLFDPAVSCANTRLYERYPEDAKDIAYIEEHMGEYLYPYEKYPRMESGAKPF